MVIVLQSMLQNGTKVSSLERCPHYIHVTNTNTAGLVSGLAPFVDSFVLFSLFPGLSEFYKHAGKPSGMHKPLLIRPRLLA